MSKEINRYWHPYIPIYGIFVILFNRGRHPLCIHNYTNHFFITAIWQAMWFCSVIIAITLTLKNTNP